MRSLSAFFHALFCTPDEPWVPASADVKLLCKSRHGPPTYAHQGDSGMDVRACLPNPSDVLTLYPHTKLLVPTGLFFAIPAGLEFQVRPRSGLSYKTWVNISNAPGTIDSPYRGELCIIVENTGDQFEIHDGDRVAQLVLAPVVNCVWQCVESMDALCETTRGTSGFGSTGR